MKSLFVLAVCMAAVLSSCDNYREADPLDVRQVKITNVNNDTLITLSNEKMAPTVRVSIVETLTDTALVKIATDTAFSKHGATFLLPVINPPLMSISGLTGDSLFIKYQPYKKPISGDLTIELTFLNAGR